METHEQGPRSHLFTVRVWAEELGAGRTEWRGKIQHVTSGEVHYFRDWSTMVSVLTAMLPEPGLLRSTGQPDELP